MQAFYTGQVVAADDFNELISFRDFAEIYEGTEQDALTEAGVAENSMADYAYAARFSIVGTEISRIELEIDLDGAGQDVTLQIRQDLTSTSDGTLIKEVTIPKEFIPNPKAYWSVPVDLTGLTPGDYWLVTKKVGDATNKVDWIGEASADAGYPVYRRPDNSGNWTTGQNALHFRIFAGELGELLHRTYSPSGYSVVVYTGEDLTSVCRYLPPDTGPSGGIRQVINYTWVGEYLKRGVRA